MQTVELGTQLLNSLTKKNIRAFTGVLSELSPIRLPSQARPKRLFNLINYGNVYKKQTNKQSNFLSEW